MNKLLVEECSAISIKTLKKDLKRARNNELRVEGQITIGNKGKNDIASYYIEGAILIISINDKEQRIPLATHQLTYGERSYIVCQCGQTPLISYIYHRKVVVLSVENAINCDTNQQV